MKKYIKPELDCNELAMANIMAASVTTLSTQSAVQGLGVEAKHAVVNSGNKFDF